MHEVPVGLMARRVATSLGETIGLVKKVEGNSNTIIWVQWLRVRLKVNVNWPLKDGCWLTVLNGKKHCVELRFEKLPDFCYICGCLDHNEKHCQFEIDFKISNAQVRKKFGPTLRVDGFRSMYS